MEVVEPTSLTNDDLVSQYRSAIRTKDSLTRFSGTDKVVLDLSDADWFTPAFLGPISVIYKRLVDQGAEIDIHLPTHQGIRTYLEQIEFPNGSVDPVETHGNHLPLCHINTDANATTIEQIGNKMSDLLSRQFSGLSSDTITWIQYPISELIDNVDYHSRCDHGSLLVQNYPNKPYLDLCVADDGISIPGSYEEFGLEFSDDEDAIKKALIESISTKPDSGYNRGYGLRTTSNMICDGLHGDVILSSGNATLCRHGGESPLSILSSFEWPGTVFIARLSAPTEEFDWTQYIR